MYKYLPSKKFILLLLSIIIFLGIIYSYFYFIRPKTLKIDQVKEETKTKIQEFVELDTDNDGLKDWEEGLLKTDPKISDTDGDGTDDNEEITLNRDPLKANTSPSNQEPNDKIPEETIIAKKEATQKMIEEYNNLTITEKMGREIFLQYYIYKKPGQSLTNAEIEEIAKKAISLLPEITFKNYFQKDIIISTSSDNESLRVYSNDLARIILEGLKTPVEGIDSILKDIPDTAPGAENTAEFDEVFQRFVPLVLKNQEIVSNLLEISVPQILLAEHLELLNSFQGIYENLDLIQKSSKDLILFTPLMNRYDSSLKNLSTAFSNIINKLLSLNILYKSKTDYGYAFFNVIMFKL